MRTVLLPLALAGVLAASSAFAAPPPPPPGPGPFAGAEPPAPGGPLPDHPPPPPPGAHVVIDRGANGVARVDVHCAQRDTTRDCAEIATRLLAETNTGPAGK